MSRDQELERNERATPHKLNEARRRGQGARSGDANALAIVLVATLACHALATPALRGLAELLARSLALAPRALDDPAAAAALLGAAAVRALGVVAPLLFAVVVAAVLAGLLQSGAVFSATPLKPDLQRLNPLQGFKRFVSLRLLYEAAKSTAKLVALTGVVALALQALLAPSARLLALPAKALPFVVADAAGGLGAKLCAVLLVFVAIDLAFVRWDFLRQMRMSRREVEDERKHREGDPRIRARQRDVRLQFLQRTRSIAKVPQASVVIANPTHVAVALKYEHGRSPAPQLVAKGAGHLAQRIREKAQRAGVPIVHSPRLARALYEEVGHDAFVPERWYPDIARILVWLQATRSLRPGGAAGALA